MIPETPRCAERLQRNQEGRRKKEEGRKHCPLSIIHYSLFSSFFLFFPSHLTLSPCKRSPLFSRRSAFSWGRDRATPPRLFSAPCRNRWSVTSTRSSST